MTKRDTVAGPEVRNAPCTGPVPLLRRAERSRLSTVVGAPAHVQALEMGNPTGGVPAGQERRQEPGKNSGRQTAWSRGAHTGNECDRKGEEN